MILPPSFTYSQSSLQDYADCPRRFYLKHLLKLAWPSIESEPIQENEHFRLQGELFHKMVHQFLIGIPAEKLSGMASDALLTDWWGNFLASQKDLFNLKNTRFFPELSVTAQFEGFHLLAKYDLLVLKDDGSCVIYDWKTYRKRPRREHLAQKLQTRIYPFVLTLSGFLQDNSRSFDLAQLSMVYWYANFPEQPETFRYSPSQYQKDERFLSKLIHSISKAAESEHDEAFPLTEAVERCLFCIYRSLCDRGIRAGDWEEESEVTELQSSLDDFNFEHISEIEF